MISRKLKNCWYSCFLFWSHFVRNSFEDVNYTELDQLKQFLCEHIQNGYFKYLIDISLIKNIKIQNKLLKLIKFNVDDNNKNKKDKNSDNFYMIKNLTKVLKKGQNYLNFKFSIVNQYVGKWYFTGRKVYYMGHRSFIFGSWIGLE